MDILNFISWIKGGRIVTSVDPAKTLIPVGLKDDRRDDGYLAGAISVEDLANQVGGNTDRLVAGTREVVLTEQMGNAVLTFDPGSVRIETSGPGSDLFISTLTGDDIVIESGDDIRLQGDIGLYDDTAEGGDINIYGGHGSDGNINDAGDGGDILFRAGNGGNSVSGANGQGGRITIQGGYTTDTGTPGGDVVILAGGSTDGTSGIVKIQGAFIWNFNANEATLEFPIVTLGTLLSASSTPGARAMISDSNVAASGNFGGIAVTGGANIVPVFSDGTDWLIG